MPQPASSSVAGANYSEPAMSAVGLFFQYLMIVSAAAHVYFTYAAAAAGDDVLPVAGGFAVFFAIWALRNYYLGRVKRERGQFTMGTVAVGAAVATVGGAPFAGHVIAIVGSLAVVASYVFVTSLLAKVTLKKLAKQFGKTSTWAAIFKTYMVVQGLTWLATLVLVVRQAMALE